MFAFYQVTPVLLSKFLRGRKNILRAGKALYFLMEKETNEEGYLINELLLF
jgi:hypothetical protein